MPLIASRRRALRTCLLGCIAGFGGGLAGLPAAAEDAVSRQDTVYVYGTLARYSEETSTSATKTETPIVDIPQALTVITRDLIDDQGFGSVADALRYVPGVTVAQGEGHRDAPVLRGNVTTADFFVDGLRDDLQYIRDVYNAERIEVLKGPSGLVFGRGTGGGAINRVTKQADGDAVREIGFGVGSFGFARATVDVGDVLGDVAQGRVNLLYERADSYREQVESERFGFAPSAGFDLSPATRLTLNGEYYSDERTTDRGVPSRNGRPFDPSEKAFFGNPELSPSRVEVATLTARLTHDVSDTLRLQTALVYGNYDKFYQNSFAASPVSATGTVQIAAYNSATTRETLLSQTDLIWTHDIAGFAQTLLLGIEMGQQSNENLRVEGQFPAAGGLERLTVSLADRGQSAAAVFGRVSQNNTNDLSLVGVYAQSQLELTDALEVVAGVRFDQFDLDFENRIGASVSRKDEFVSPRLGIVYSPVEPLSIYASWSRAYLPQSGEQFSGLTPTRALFDPEEFENREIGVKWQPSDELLLTAALFRLDRTNTLAPGPVAGTVVATGAQRSEGLELSLQGEVREGWDVFASYAWQVAEITETTSAAPAGRKVALVPEHSASLWSKMRVTSTLDTGIGLVWQDDQFASISNAVVLPSYARIDAAVFYALSDRLDLQLNLENLTGETYAYASHNDNNISLGAPLTAKIRLSASF